MYENNAECKNHAVSIDCRKQISISGVTDVVEFDEGSIILNTEGGKLLVEGSGLQITTLDVESGKLCAAGKIDALLYGDGNEKKSRGLFSRILK